MFEKVIAKDSVLAKLITDIAAFKKLGKRKFPEEIIERCVNYVDSTKITGKGFAEVSGIAQSTIAKWKNDYAPAEPFHIVAELPEIEHEIPEIPNVKKSGLVTIKIGDKIRIETTLDMLNATIKELGIEV